MKSYTPSLIGWIVLFPIACVTLFDKNIRFPVSLSITLGLVMFLGQFTSLFWGLCGIIVNSNRKDDLIALILSGTWLVIMIIGFASKKRFIYHGYLQIAELDAAVATETAMPVLRKTYLWDLLEPVATRILAMSLFDETGTWAEDLYCTHDLLKNATALFGIRAGRRALYEYGPYGNILRMEGNAAEDNPFRFSSEYADDELGLVYYNYRYYNTQNGRWISRDPIIEKQKDNVYSYAYNTPSILIDVQGQFAFAIALFNPIGAAVVAAAAVGVAVAVVVVVAEKVIDEISSDTTKKTVPETVPIAIPQKPRYGNCSKQRHSELNKEVGRKCKGSSMHCKNKNMCKNEIERNIKRFQDCIDARTKINNECFNGGDNAHNDEIERALAGKKRCQDKLNQLL